MANQAGSKQSNKNNNPLGKNQYYPEGSPKKTQPSSGSTASSQSDKGSIGSDRAAQR